ncbi:hypothetical protein EDC39_12024 [Geothermobacter ehrlichii]|uniref:Uncharacterized protein n=1 Tax=Geothermobacter ehrlichii TaxID=213224 RepID=A0A5D3WGX8_9BACT|nr:hypothetical protein EDC39_12024 [Geothermobacter ehrlichii]
MPDCFLHQFFNSIKISQIGCNRKRIISMSLDFISNAVAILLVAADNDNIGAGAGQTANYASSNPLGTACDKSNFPLEITRSFHCFLSQIAIRSRFAELAKNSF